MSSILNRFELASFKRMLNNAKQVHKYSNRNTLYILYDMAKCIIFDKVGYMEYNLFHFIDKPKELRDTYVTFEYSQYLFKTLNNREYVKTFNDKLEFNKLFKDIMQRDFIDIENSSLEEFKAFIKNKKAIFCKPNDSCSGKGLYRKIEIDDNTNIEDLYNYLKENKVYAEDLIIQHPLMSSLHKESINTIRITTLYVNNVAHVMYALLRIGTNHSMVDNVGSGGIYSVLSESGEIVYPAWSDKTIRTYDTHPTSGVKLLGFKVPYFNEAIELCKKAAEVVPSIQYVGWDIAITDKGPVIVEGNPLPGYDMAQNFFASGKDYGLKPEFEKILK